MLLKKTGLLMGLFLLNFSTFLKAQQTNLTLEQLLVSVEEHSKEIALENLKNQISQTKIKQAKSNQLPTLTFFGSVRKASNMPIYNNGILHKPAQHDVIHTLYDTNTNLYFNIFDGFKTKNEIKLAKILSEISATDREKLISATKLKAIQLFIDLHLQHQWKTTMENDIHEKEQQLKEIKNIYKAGIILESDVLRAELELSKRKMTLTEIENSIIVLQQQLNILMGYDDKNILNPKVIFDEQQIPLVTLDESIEKALQQSFDTELSHRHKEAAETKLQLNKGNYYPKIGLAGSFQFSNPQIFLYSYDPSWYSLGTIGIQATYDISSLYHNKNKVQEAKIEVSAAHLHHQFINDEVRTKVFHAFYEYDEALKHEKVFEQNQKYADENARILKNAYFNQTALITDLLDANLLQVQAKFELEQAKMNILKTYYSLQFETGTL
ncbi:TolC family protein [Chryseobacterium sp.]|uniref:TolC family protein n=1 Tax=Chryseobacterium sp. TaxID=1871047 RepID=UPI00289C0671|nr:TolC family protein [Chryseobacterium sp.]